MPAWEARQLNKLWQQMSQCGGFLGFRHYPTIDELRLHVGYFCQQDKLCPLCALRRASKVLRLYSDRVAQVLAERPALTGCMVTLTVKDGPDLAERLRHLIASYSRQLEVRKKRLSSINRPWSEWALAAGGVSRIEIKRGKNSGEWHPHIHSAWLCEALPDEDQLRDEWHRITGDSHQVRVSPFQQLRPGCTSEQIAGDLVEVLKYAVKFSDISLADAYHVHQLTRGVHLLRPFGILRGVKLPDSLLDDPLTDTDLPFVELFFRYSAGKYIDTRNHS